MKQEIATEWWCQRRLNMDVIDVYCIRYRCTPGEGSFRSRLIAQEYLKLDKNGEGITRGSWVTYGEGIAATIEPALSFGGSVWHEARLMLADDVSDDVETFAGEMVSRMVRAALPESQATTTETITGADIRVTHDAVAP